MGEYIWFLIFGIGVPCICVTTYCVVDRICRYKEEKRYRDDD